MIANKMKSIKRYYNKLFSDVKDFSMRERNYDSSSLIFQINFHWF